MGCGSAGASPSRGIESNLGEELLQPNRVFSEFAAVVAGADRKDAVPGGRLDRGTHCLGDGCLVDAIDYDFIGAVAPGTNSDSTSVRSVGQNASAVEACRALYFEPTLLPLRQTPPGNDAMTPGNSAIAAAARRTAARPAV